MNDLTQAPASLDALLAVTPLREGVWRFVVLDGWQQGRGAFGGLVMGALIRAAQAAEPDASRRVRSVTGEIPAPVGVGEAEIAVVALRRGANVSTWRATMTQAGEVVAQAVAVMGGARRLDARWCALTPPPPSRWEDHSPLPFVEGMFPTFAQAFEFRTSGPLPFGAHDDDARAEGWIRPRAPCATRDAAWVAALADAFWPALLARMDAPRPTATVAFTLQLALEGPSIPDGPPLRYRASCPLLDEGYAVEFRELWTDDGRLVALNQQTFVVIR